MSLNNIINKIIIIIKILWYSKKNDPHETGKLDTAACHYHTKHHSYKIYSTTKFKRILLRYKASHPGCFGIE